MFAICVKMKVKGKSWLSFDIMKTKSCSNVALNFSRKRYVPHPTIQFSRFNILLLSRCFWVYWWAGAFRNNVFGGPCARYQKIGQHCLIATRKPSDILYKRRDLLHTFLNSSLPF